MDFCRDLNPGQANASPQGPDAMVLRSEPDGTLKQSSMTFGSGPFSLIAAAQSLTALPRWKIEGEAQLLESTLDGDFVVTRGAPTKLILSGLASIISIASDQNVRFVPFKAERDVVVFTGTPKLPLPDTNTGDPPTFTVTVSDRNRELNSKGGPLFHVLDMLGVSFNTPMINETTVSNSMVFLNVEPGDAASADPSPEKFAKDLNLALKREKRTLDLWRLEIVN